MPPTDRSAHNSMRSAPAAAAMTAEGALKHAISRYFIVGAAAAAVVVVVAGLKFGGG